jgi:phage terminase small subunit
MARKRKSPDAPAAPALTDLQRRFAEEYVVDLNATQAAIRAGYAPASAGIEGHRLLKNAKIDAIIRAEMQAMADRTHVSQDFVLRGLIANYNRAMQAEPVLDREGNATGEYEYEGSVANKSLELIGKHLGMFREKADLSVNWQTAPSDQLVTMLPAALEARGITGAAARLLIEHLGEALKDEA